MIRNTPPKREGGKMRIRAFPVSRLLHVKVRSMETIPCRNWNPIKVNILNDIVIVNFVSFAVNQSWIIVRMGIMYPVQGIVPEESRHLLTILIKPENWWAHPTSASILSNSFCFIFFLDEYGWKVCGIHLESIAKCHPGDSEEEQLGPFVRRIVSECVHNGLA